MAYQFEDDDNWAAEIEEETSKAEYQNAEIRIEDLSLLTRRDYDEVTGLWDIEGDSRVYSGRARLIPVRWGVESGGESQANATTLSAVRIQIPRYGLSAAFYGEGLYGTGPFGYSFGSAGRVRKGSRVIVVECHRNPALENLPFTITSDLQGSMSATRTFQAMLDGDARMP